MKWVQFLFWIGSIMAENVGETSNEAGSEASFPELEEEEEFENEPFVPPQPVVTLESLKQGGGLIKRTWSHLPPFVCNTLGPLIRKQLPFI
jgi:hypothetical protein